MEFPNGANARGCNSLKTTLFHEIGFLLWGFPASQIRLRLALKRVGGFSNLFNLPETIENQGLGFALGVYL